MISLNNHDASEVAVRSWWNLPIYIPLHHLHQKTPTLRLLRCSGAPPATGLRYEAAGPADAWKVVISDGEIWEKYGKIKENIGELWENIREIWESTSLILTISVGWYGKLENILEHIGRWEIYGEIQGAGRPVDPFFSGRLNIASCSTAMLQKLQSLRAPRAISVKFSDQNYAFRI